MEFRTLTSCLGLALAAFVVGCSEEPDSTPPIAVMDTHDEHAHEHDHPETIAEAVLELTALWDSIRGGFENNDEEAAHGPLHDVGHVLEKVVGLAEEEGISGEQLVAVTDAKESLLDAFGEIDKKLHGGEGATYDEVSGKIDAALKKLSDAVDAGSSQEVTEDESVKAIEDSDDSPETKESPETEDAAEKTSADDGESGV